MLPRTLLICALCSCAFAMLTEPSGCGSEFGCYSSGCDGDACDFVITWLDGGGATVDFSLHLNLDKHPEFRNQWIALGLSSDASMGDDSVTECVQTGDAEATLAKSWNTGSPLNNIPLPDASNKTEGLSAMSRTVTDGVLMCSYSQTKVSTKQELYDLNTDWHLLVATGSSSGGSKSPHAMDVLPAVSPSKVDLQSKDNISGSIKFTLVKAHGCMMIIAWVLFASIGIFMARFYKPMWPNSTLLKEKVWFTIHRSCMVMAFLACAAGFVLIFVEVQDWSELDGSSSFQQAHPILGVIVTFLCVLNPIMAVFRPHADGKNRFLFNWAHWFVGTSAHILAALTLILGVTLAKASVPFYCVWVLVGWAGYQVAIVLLMEMHECCVADNRIKYMKDGAVVDPRGSGLRQVALAFHVLVIGAFTVALVVIVAIN